MARAPSKAEKAKSQTEPGRYGLGDGLYLQITPSGTKSYIYRYKVHGRARHMGLGSVKDMDLTEARKRAAKARSQVRDGIDPVEQKSAQKLAAKQQRERTKSFEECAVATIAIKTRGLKNEKHKAQWKSTLETYLYPVFGSQPVGTITKDHVLAALSPIWDKVPETASRVRGRIEAVFDYAKARGFREGDNPAAWKGNLQELLGNGEKLQRHQPSLPYPELAKFMADLRKREGISALALEFAILCASRSGEVLGATWDEIDLEAKLWTIPAARMKAKRAHEVPLTDAALAVLRKVPQLVDVPYVFPAVRGGKLTDMVLSMLIRRMNGLKTDTPPIYVDRVSGDRVVPHGFRSTFREWAGNETAHGREVIEHALAHRLPDTVERAYQRSTYLPLRVKLMEDWAIYCARKAV